MTVRQSLLAILDQGPCYGYQLRAEYARRTSAASPLNVGQIYTTLERLERDGLVAKRGADDRGHVYWGITQAGRTEVRAWFATPDSRAGRDDLAHKIALAATLPGVDAVALVSAQREAARDRMRGLAQDAPGAEVSASIVRLAERAQARAEVEWLDAVAALVDEDRGRSALPLSSERPRRGRPVRER